MIRRYFLQELRYQSGYFARKVAKDMGYSRATLYRKEAGKTPLRNNEVVKFAKYYGVDPEEIKKHYKVAK